MRISNRNEECFDSPTGFHLWSPTGMESAICEHCGEELTSQWVEMPEEDEAEVDEIIRRSNMR
jgi:hypothetical protein